MNTKRRSGRARAILSFAAVLMLAANISQAKYSGGTGEPNNPYRIATPNDLNDIGNHPEDFNDCFILVSDINMAGFTYTTALIAPDINNSSDYFQGAAFTGIFDGNDCNISNLTVDTAGAGNDYLGLFGQIYEPGQVKNLGIEDANITGGDYSSWLGALCAVNGGTITNCHANGFVTGGDDSRCIGALVGVNGDTYLLGATINHCYTASSVTGGHRSWYLGGLCGGNFFGTIRNSYSTSSVTGGSYSQYLGGLCGQSFSGTISKCYAAGSVSGDYDSSFLGGLCGETHGGGVSECWATGFVSGGLDSYAVGGLVGYNMARITDSYATANVSGYTSVGGLVGTNVGTFWPGVEIHRAYAAGSVSGSQDVGGLLGEDKLDGFYAACFWDTDINPGLGGIGNTTDPNVIGKTTAEMQTQSTFTGAGWDFVGETANGTDDIWRMCIDGVTYPLLWWQFTCGDFVCPDGVTFIDYTVLANHWRDINCSSSNDCDRTDLDFSDAVNWADLKIFCDHWLQGAGP